MQETCRTYLNFIQNLSKDSRDISVLKTSYTPYIVIKTLPDKSNIIK